MQNLLSNPWVKRILNGVIIAAVLLGAYHLSGLGSQPRKNGVVHPEGTTIEGTLSGGSGRASIVSPMPLFTKNGQDWVRVTWNSPHYQFMRLEKEYQPIERSDKTTVFEVPVNFGVSNEIAFVAQTTAMSKPYDIEYKILFDTSTIKSGSEPMSLLYIGMAFVVVIWLLVARKGGGGC